MNKLIFQLVLQLTELTCRGQQSQLSSVDSAEDQEGEEQKGKPSQPLSWLRRLPRPRCGQTLREPESGAEMKSNLPGMGVGTMGKTGKQ